MRDHKKKHLGALAAEDSFLIEPKAVDTEKDFNGFMRALRDVL